MRALRSLVVVPVVLSVLAIACGVQSEASTPTEESTPAAPPAGGRVGAPNMVDAPPGACPAQAPPACARPADVATADAFFAVLLAGAPVFPDETLRPAHGVALQPSGDLRVTTTLELTADDLRARWNPCASEKDGGSDFASCQAPSFAPEQPRHLGQANGFGFVVAQDDFPSGVTCTAMDRGTCTKVRIAAGAVVRLQRAESRYFFASTHGYFVRFVRPCATPCAPDEIRCAASSTCFRAGYDSCMLCEGLGGETCSCRAGCGQKSVGAGCGYDLSDDYGVSGTCDGSGTCVAR